MISKSAYLCLIPMLFGAGIGRLEAYQASAYREMQNDDSLSQEQVLELKKKEQHHTAMFYLGYGTAIGSGLVGVTIALASLKKKRLEDRV